MSKLQTDALPVKIGLYNAVLDGSGMIRDITRAVGATWVSSIRRIGGFWLATCEYDGTEDELEEMFTQGLARELRLTQGGAILWQGFIAELDLERAGVKFTRRWAKIRNRVKAIYTRIGPNQFTNGSAEAGAWTAYNGGTPTQSTEWVSHGAYSCKIAVSRNLVTNPGVESAVWAAYNTPPVRAQYSGWVYEGTYSCRVTADAANDGVTIQSGGINIIANTAYAAWLRVKIISGTWKLEIYQTDDGTPLTSTLEGTTGEHTLKANVTDQNTYAGEIGIRLYCTGSSGEIYADGAEFFAVDEGAGATIQDGIEVLAGKGYQCQVTVNIVSGVWRLAIYDDTLGTVLAYMDESVAGQRVMRVMLSDTSTFSGTIGVYLVALNSAAEAYGDAGIFQDAPARAETAWYQDTASRYEWGVIEEILLLAGAADETANAKAQTALAQAAQPRTQVDAAENLKAENLKQEPDAPKSRLRITAYGYVFTIRNKYTLLDGSDTATAQVEAVRAEAQLVDAGRTETNTMLYQIENRGPVRVWEVLREIALAGDASGNLWQIGVYARRKLDYEMTEFVLQARMRGGRFYNPAGGLLEPWLALPGYVQIDDFPGATGSPTATNKDNVRIVLFDEVEFDAGDWLKNGSGLKFRAVE